MTLFVSSIPLTNKSCFEFHIFALEIYLSSIEWPSYITSLILVSAKEIIPFVSFIKPESSIKLLLIFNDPLTSALSLIFKLSIITSLELAFNPCAVKLSTVKLLACIDSIIPPFNLSTLKFVICIWPIVPPLILLPIICASANFISPLETSNILPKPNVISVFCIEPS